MNTKILMTSSSVILGLIGIFALFAPDSLLSMAGVSIARQLTVLIQLMGALYFSLAIMNWTIKDGVIGGVYQRPVSLANFAHFFCGALVLARYHLSSPLSPFLLAALVVYALFAILFYWLVFRHTGIKPS